MSTAPDLYGINDNELHDELQRIDVECTVDIDGVAVSAGMRCDPITGEHYPVVVVRGTAGLHLLCAARR